MGNRALGKVLNHVRELVAAHEEGAVTDRELLERFLAQRDQTAFAALVRRHGSMVFGVCRRVLRQTQDAEDACQAAFLVLARKASSIRKGESLGSWLYSVAYRIARKLAGQLLRRKTRLAEMAATPAPDDRAQASWKEFLAVLDEELNRLPAGYRAPLVLCYLEEQTQDQAARNLGWTLGKLRGQLERGRELLRSRLARRGMALSIGLLAANLAAEKVSALPGLWAGSLAAAATTFASGGNLPGALARAAALAHEALKGMAMSKLALAAAFLLTLTVVAAGAGLAARPLPTVQEAGPDPAATRKETPPTKANLGQSDRYGDPLPPRALTRLGSERFRHGGVIWAVVFAPDGKTLASAGTDHTVRLWEAATGKPLATLADAQAVGDPYIASRWLYCLAYAPDGKTLAAGEFERGHPGGAIHLWDPASGKERLRLQGHRGGVMGVAFSPDGKTLASAGVDRIIRLWDTATGNPVLTVAGHRDECRGVAFTRDGKGLVSVAADGTVRLWDPKTGKERWRIERQYGGTRSMALADDGKLFASAGIDKSVGLYHPDTGKEVRRLRGLPAKAHKVAFSPNGKVLAVGLADGVIQLWDPGAGRKLRVLADPHGAIQSLAFSKDSQTLAAAVGAETIRRWDVATGKEIPAPGGHRGPVGFVAFTSDSKTLVSAGWDWTVRLWELDTGKQRGHYLAPQVQGRTVALSHDGQLLALSRKGGAIVLVDAGTGKERRRLAGHTDDVVTLAFGPGDKTLASAGKDSKVRLWDIATGRAAHVLSHDNAVMLLAYAADGKLLASATGDQLVHLWDPATGKELRRVDHSHKITSLALAPDGRTLAAGGQDGMVTLWDAPRGLLLRRVGPHAGYVIALAFAPDSRTLAVGNWRGIRIWELATGSERLLVPAHQGDVTALAFGPDGRTLASAGNDTTILVWDLTGRRVPPGQAQRAKPTPAELRRLWDALGDKDAGPAGRALWDLALAPAEAVPFLKGRLVPPKGRVDAHRLAALIEDLDADTFSVRESAEKELRRLGPAAEAALRKALEGTPSPEVQMRVQRLLQQLAPDALSPQRLRVLRAVEVLERAGTLAARRVLRSVGQGAEGDGVTRQAKASLTRLEKRPSAK